MSFTASGGVPELFTYSLVGNEGLDIISGLNKVNPVSYTHLDVYKRQNVS